MKEKNYEQVKFPRWKMIRNLEELSCGGRNNLVNKNKNQV